MPEIRPSKDLTSNYNEISEYCHRQDEPVFITKDGAGDLAVMSIRTYERIIAKNQLQEKLDKGFADLRKGRVMPVEDAFRDVEIRLKHE